MAVADTSHLHSFQVDSKKELEKALKATCEAFIMGATKATVEEMLSFITKVTAVKVASTTGTVTKPLREQARLLLLSTLRLHVMCL